MVNLTSEGPIFNSGVCEMIFSFLVVKAGKFVEESFLRRIGVKGASGKLKAAGRIEGEVDGMKGNKLLRLSQ